MTESESPVAKLIREIEKPSYYDALENRMDYRAAFESLKRLALKLEEMLANECGDSIELMWYYEELAASVRDEK